jgi:hypothetical protein
MVQLTEDERGWLLSKIPPEKNESAVVRWLIDAERKREAKR